LTAAPASADGLVKEAGQALPTEVDQAVNRDPGEVRFFPDPFHRPVWRTSERHPGNAENAPERGF
jgi:hypothetical protein